MPTTLTYGNRGTRVLESSQVTHIQPKLDLRLPEADLSNLLRASLREPLEYPPFANATVPGDRVVLAIEYGTPCPCQLLEGTLAALRDAGVEASNTTLLLDPSFSQETELCEQLKQLAQSNEIELLVHDPKDDSSHTIVGVTKTGRPLRLSRMLADADLVLPLGVRKPQPGNAKQETSFGSLFPIFSDQETLDRYRAPIAGDSKVICAERQHEINESGWLLGVGLTIQIVPDHGLGVAAIFAGEPQAVAKAASQQYQAIWTYESKKPSELVVATITGDSSQQTWANVGRALEAAEQVLEPGGAIALCSDLTAPPGPSLQRLAGSEGSQEVERELMRDRFPDSWTALRLSRALERGPVYFRSQLPPNLVESLGLAPLADDKELSRLVAQSQSCLVLDGAQRLLATVD